MKSVHGLLPCSPPRGRAATRSAGPRARDRAERDLSTLLTRLVIAALVVMALARFVPLAAAQIVTGAAAVVALWPVAYAMLRHPDARRAAQAAAVAAT